MKRILSCLLVVLLVAMLSAVPVGAEDTAVVHDVPDVGQIQSVVGDLEALEKALAEVETEAEDIALTIGEGIPEDVEMIEPKLYAESQSTGFFGWLQNLWQAILRFFGL